MSKKSDNEKIHLQKIWVECYYQYQYKTAIIGRELPHTYVIVTRQNYVTAQLWLNWRNDKVKGRKDFITLPDKPNWLVMNKNFRRQQEIEIRNLN